MTYPKPGELTLGWRWVLALGWVGVVVGLIGVADAARVIHKPPFWLDSGVLIAVPFALPLCATVAAFMNHRYATWIAGAAVLSLAVVAVGEDARGPVTIRYDLTARPQRQPPLSAVARDTGFPPSIVAQLLMAGRIRERGVRPPEQCVPVRPFLDALAERGFLAKATNTHPA